MSPEAVSRRLRQVGELVEACRALRIKPGSVRPVGNAASLGGCAEHPAADPVVRDKVQHHRNDPGRTGEPNPAQRR